MFGYHDNDRCNLDLWSPVDDQCQGIDTIYTHPHQKPGWETAIENRVFSPYCKHEQEKEDIIEEIVARAHDANFAGYDSVNFSIDLDDDFSDEDLEEIRIEARRRF